MLQSATMAYTTVTQKNVYLTAGAAMPEVIEGILTSMLNDSFDEGHRKLSQVQQQIMC